MDKQAVMDLLYARRSVRKFTETPVSREILDELLRAAMAAPSARNKRPWRFIVADTREHVKKLERVLLFGRHGAQAAIVVCAQTGGLFNKGEDTFWVQDGSAAIENILTAAPAFGLGTCWIGITPVQPIVKGVRTLLRLPKGVEPLGAVLIGYPAEGAVNEPRTQYDEKNVYYLSDPPQARESWMPQTDEA